MIEEKIDVLQRDEFIEKLKKLVEIIADTNRGCCFGLDGAWGSGKSFVLEKFENDIKEIQSEETNDSKYFVFHYDCWKYDYYEEPAIAIISAMLDVADRELHILPSNQRDSLKKLGWTKTKEILKEIANGLCKNKIGINLVEIATSMIDEQGESTDDFEFFCGFKRTLEDTRNGIQKIANRKTVIIVVDELDRCLPTYTIKVLERIHHVFADLKNVIVIVSMDKTQIEHSIKEIYGEINVDIYLRKFISFKINLDNGKADRYIEKYESYTSMFELTEQEKREVEDLFSDLMNDMDIRTQERIFSKAETIHKLIYDENVIDGSIMTFEILFLTLSLKLKTNNLEWLIQNNHDVNIGKILGKKYYDMLKKYERHNREGGHKINNCYVIPDDLVGRTFFWIANLYNAYDLQTGICGPYYYKKSSQERIEIVKRFAEIIDYIDCD